jgi:hypothetical protein
MSFLSVHRTFTLASTFIFFLSSSIMSVAVDCGNTIFNTVNATGSVQFPGFEFRQSEPTIENNTWRISTAVTESLSTTTNTTETQQDFWLNTNPPVTSNLTDLPYWGCVFLLQGFKQEPISNGTNDSSSCNGVFDSDCYNTITSVATSSAWKFNTNVASIAPVCRDIGQAITSPIPSQCKNSPWSSFIQAGKSLAAMFTSVMALVVPPEHLLMRTKVPFGDIGSTSGTCNNKVFNGSATQAPILSLDSDISTPGNFTDYDTWVRRASPILMTVFKKTFVGDQSPRWADSRLVCLTAKSITAGSRVPTCSSAQWYGRPTMSSILMAVVWAMVYAV